MSNRSPRRLRAALAAFTALTLFAGVASGHGGGLSAAQAEELSVPTWLFLATGGGVVGASFLLASFATDREFLQWVHRAARPLSLPRDALRWVGRAVGLLGLGFVLVSGFFGPHEALLNAAILLVWVGWWAGYTMSVYLVGNSWPALDPFRTLALPLREGRVDYDGSLGAWPSVVALLGLVWVEVVSPVADDPRALAALVAAYLGVSLLGAALLGRETWFAEVDPVSRVFRLYGCVAPVQRSPSGLELKFPGMAAVDTQPADDSEAAFVVALVWATTFDGFTTTPLWTDVATALVGAGVPTVALYPGLLAGGFAVFLGVYWTASAAARRVAPTYRSAGSIARLFAPSLVAIAAAYHLAHYLAYFLRLLPALVEALLTPLVGTGEPALLALPAWVGALPVVFVLLGHLVAIWVAHSAAYDAFPDRLQALRSQYAVTAVMVFYTMTSLWIVTRPFSAPPYV